jgi:predicted O-methyltransferase YrrM
VYDAWPEWEAVDRYFAHQLVGEDDALAEARRASRAAGLPEHEVASNQAKLLSLLCRMIGARRVLEFGTLGGYSTIWLARAVGEQGHVTTLELDESSAAVARRNFAGAGVAERIRLMIGPAVASVQDLVAAREEPFDLVFVDADKPNNATYLDGAVQLSRPGTVIVVDNVVRNGDVTDANSTDPRVRGTREVLRAISTHPRLDGTALQTVGSKGWDGFALAVVDR